MEIQNLIVREMRDGEQKALVKLAHKAFPCFEALFVNHPKRAMVAEYDGQLVGGMMYKFNYAGNKKVAYIEQAFVDPAYHGNGVAKQMYTQTFRFLWEQGCDAITALVKDDNIGSWKPCMDNGFQRVSITEACKRIGCIATAVQCFTTPLLLGVGMDFYLAVKEPVAAKPTGTLTQAITYFIVNILLAFPLFLLALGKGSSYLLSNLLAFVTVFGLFLLPRLAAAVVFQKSCHFRLNHGGGGLAVWMGLFNNIFPMNANWYPNVYEKTPKLKRRMAIPELVKWVIFLLLPLLPADQSIYFDAVAKLGYVLLIFMIIPVFPFESFGAGRIYRYNKVLWGVTAVLSILAMCFVY